MKEKLIAFVGVLLAAYVVYGLFIPQQIEDTIRRPLSNEAGPHGYLGLWRWLDAAGVPVVSFREPYSTLTDLDVRRQTRGDVMIVSIPYVDRPRRAELDALYAWAAQGNTVMMVVTLNDTLPWSGGCGDALGAIGLFEELTGIMATARSTEDSATWPRDFSSVPVKGHWLTEGIESLAAHSDWPTDVWDLESGPDEPAFVLATTPETAGDALLIQSVGAGAFVISTYGSLLQNSMLGQRDNRRFVINLLRHHLAPQGRVLFDDGHQGLSAVYDARAFMRDPRLWSTLGLFLAFWLLYAVFAETRLGRPVEAANRASQADFVRTLGGFLARKVSRRDAGLRLIENFLVSVAPQLGPASQPTDEQTWQRVAAAQRMDPELADALQRDHRRLLDGHSVKLEELQGRLRAARRAFS
jgi:hypothetical protein